VWTFAHHALVMINRPGCSAGHRVHEILSNSFQIKANSFRIPMRWYFSFFVLSGFCALVYEVIWLRLAMASFGVTAAVVSIVLSMFMAGLGLGAWLTGLLMRKNPGPAFALRVYGLAELLVGVSSFVVPYELKLGRSLLLSSASGEWQSSTYYLLGGLWIAVTLIPWCACMGSTFPMLMAVMRAQSPRSVSQTTFSYLYLANVLGAAAGTLASAFVLIELLGFTKTLLMAGALNAVLAGSAVVLSFFVTPANASADSVTPAVDYGAIGGMGRGSILALLFISGLVSMGMEVIWIRQLTPYLGNVVYAFSGIVAVYLLATCIGSRAYRSWMISHRIGDSASRWSSLALSAVIPLIGADPLMPFRLHGLELGGVRLASIVWFCATAGFLTPLLLDAWSGGDPRRAGTAYAVNLLGSIAGPLAAGFWLLPSLGERRAMALLALPLFVAAGVIALRKEAKLLPDRSSGLQPKTKFVVMTLAAVLIYAISHDYEKKFSQREVRRDYAATVIGTGSGFGRQLLVNGTGMTWLTPVTKYMSHLPLAMMSRPTQKGLVICFGMGTSFRSMLSWGISTTAVDLIPSVPALFGYFHPDAASLLKSQQARIVVDDGRRFLDTSNETYDVIVVDPPPPPSAPGSSLLYSREFYDIVKRHLAAGGILGMWYPASQADFATAASIAKALKDSFPHVRAFFSVDEFGIHFLASMEPLPTVSAAILAARLPSAAASDFLEWGPERDLEKQFDILLSREVPMNNIVALAPRTPALRDDEPINEYYLLRRWVHLYR
jgi:spermidine synthase